MAPKGKLYNITKEKHLLDGKIILEAKSDDFLTKTSKAESIVLTNTTGMGPTTKYVLHIIT